MTPVLYAAIPILIAAAIASAASEDSRSRYTLAWALIAAAMGCLGVLGGEVVR